MEVLRQFYRERQRMDFSLVTYKTKVDEDKGSPLQDGVNPGEVLPGENRQFSGSPSGVPSPVLSFPPNRKTCNNTARATLRIKLQGMAFNLSLRAYWGEAISSKRGDRFSHRPDS
jgi:hypothetical protein